MAPSIILILNRQRGKGGRRLKVFRLVYERATREKINRKMNRNIYRVLRKLAKKHRLTTKKREKTAMYVKDLAEYLQANLTTIKKRFTHGRNRPSALLKLRYRDIIITLLRHPNSGPHRILIEFTYEFTKKFLSEKDT
ncbi:hypothetical protein BJ875DRAFT_507659 [Amylocarpus encephaloides]|uniref:Uncharacterized protein n=1 Tax=Amylocarpus encephaloides TaxID=45428 RepID=A0A9P7YA14_9HELO|nr:hypothetical protein BJ875DRAFT_507659 [Amylocarpus encephaloides]